MTTLRPRTVLDLPNELLCLMLQHVISTEFAYSNARLVCRRFHGLLETRALHDKIIQIHCPHFGVLHHYQKPGFSYLFRAFRAEQILRFDRQQLLSNKETAQLLHIRSELLTICEKGVALLGWMADEIWFQNTTLGILLNEGILTLPTLLAMVLPLVLFFSPFPPDVLNERRVRTTREHKRPFANGPPFGTKHLHDDLCKLHVLNTYLDWFAESLCKPQSRLETVLQRRKQIPVWTFDCRPAGLEGCLTFRGNFHMVKLIRHAALESSILSSDTDAISDEVLPARIIDGFKYGDLAQYVLTNSDLGKVSTDYLAWKQRP